MCGAMVPELGLIGEVSMYCDVWGYGVRVGADWPDVIVL